MATPPARCSPLRVWTSIAETVTEVTPFLSSGQHRAEVTKRAHAIKAVLYAIQNFYAFMIM